MTDTINKTILVTGAAGFIGYHLCERLLDMGHRVIGLDNINDYYDVGLKYARLAQLGIAQESVADGVLVGGDLHGDAFRFVKMDLEDKARLPELFEEVSFDIVCNLAAQAGVRYSLEAPIKYIESNILGFMNLLECVRHHGIQKLVYASSSSVYGMNKKIPFSTDDSVDHPVSIYAATKKSNELMAHTYSHLFGIETIGLRFFTVYGPWGRPDMAMFLFTDAILNNRPIKVFNNGDLSRDFTYIDDIIEGVLATLLVEREGKPLYSVYNIGNSKPVSLMAFINAVEEETGRTAEKVMYPMQPGDVAQTWADVTQLEKDFGYHPNTPIKRGVGHFVRWYLTYHAQQNNRNASKEQGAKNTLDIG